MIKKYLYEIKRYSFPNYGSNRRFHFLLKKILKFWQKIFDKEGKGEKLPNFDVKDREKRINKFTQGGANQRKFFLTCSIL